METSTSRQRTSGMPVHKYQRYEKFPLPDRQWPDRMPERAPLWASVDLRDGNQALIDPMDMDRRWAMYRLLLRMGFKEIEVGFPLSSQADRDFTRAVIEQDAIPDDVTIQVMSPIRDGMIEETVRSVRGAPRVILQIYNPTSTAQRRVVFGMSREEVKQLALVGAERALKLRDSLPGTEIHLQYGTESFTQTEPEFALEVCNAVLNLWRPEPSEQCRIVLPSTVECYPPHEFADRIEWMHRNLAHREAIILSLHQHNDRGSGIASAELALLAGADRVEGTLFGNGERAGNVDLITLAMNLYTQGIDPQLDLSFLDEARQIVEYCNRLPVPPRQPWAGDFVYTSFAGSHQDAISKGLTERGTGEGLCWDVPYLPVDPRDVGRDYQALIRINQQSGKGGIAYLMKQEHGYVLPRRLQIELAAVVQARSEATGEVTPERLLQWFTDEYLADDPGESVPGEQAESALAALLAGRRLRGTLRELVVQQPDAATTDSTRREGTRTDGTRTGWKVYVEVAAGASVRWGVGEGATKGESLGRALRSAVRRLAAVTLTGSEEH
ncbi:2-isopropylmalate synthase [Streptomyces sp. NPDC015032]|uniref:2-isopropylmalate synthase n=1 Tax=Streptomyces sp. NPDC015032 TaxID=3364937 RepID=UPI003701BCCC